MRALPFSDLRHPGGKKKRKPPRFHEISVSVRYHTKKGQSRVLSLYRMASTPPAVGALRACCSIGIT